MLEALSPSLLAILATVAATLLALYVAPKLIAAAHRYGIVDRPSTALKTHKAPVPYLGGLVVFIAFLIALALTFPFSPQVLAVLLSASLVVAVGLVDDLGTLTPRDKLLGQLLAAAVLVKAGVKIDIVALPFPFDELLSVLWLVTAMNAFNILDVSDGLATSAALVGALGAGVVALINGEATILALSAALFGACLGFLRFNRQPARMYLGDTGALFLGLMIGALAMIGRYSEVNDVSAWFVPLALLAAPLFDLLLVIVARLRARRPIWHGSPDHYAVRLRHHGWSARGIARLTLLGGSAVVAVAIGSMWLDDGPALVVAAGTIAAGLVAVAVFLLRFPPKVAVADPSPNAPAEALVGSETA